MKWIAGQQRTLFTFHRINIAANVCMEQHPRKTPPPLENPFEAIQKLAADLRDPEGGCPWDIEQTHKSLIENLIEETYEVVDAIEALDQIDKKGDEPVYAELMEELGDLFFQVVFHAQIASENNRFNLEDVARVITEKLIFRHPHVYTGDTEAKNSSEVLKNWEALKRKEKQKKNKEEHIFSGIPSHLPALLKSYRMGQKAARVNFDWKDQEGRTALVSKIFEEWEELKEELPENPDVFNNPSDPDITSKKDRAELEFGDLLFVIAQYARHYYIDPERALQRSNRKFQNRFASMENQLADQLKNHQLPEQQEWENAWKQAKEQEKK